ncbi:unnamed protein product [Phytophthora fragariaefolia]|uniref:Unnamed protein product n=1 Tax=Phytophthora fragariaefolia TaxID=1490495 RepID=A0A9W6TW81_9STRA|nr:unnamed protein product [Phytophthora fragariaefolia]
MVKLAVGNRVQGKSKSTLGKEGVVLSIDNSKRQPWYSVLWGDGSVQAVSARAIQLLQPLNSDSDAATWNQPTASLESMTALLLAGAGSGLGPGDWSSSESESSSEEEDEEDSVDVTSTMVSGISNDGKVLAHNRIWEFCSDLLVDPAALQRKRKTFFFAGHRR